MVEGQHQGVVAQVAAYEYAQLDELYKRAEERNEQPFFLILDELEDPHNLGSIMRTADAVGAHGIVIPKRRAVGLTSTVAKASTGAIEHIPVVKVTNLARTLDEMKERGFGSSERMHPPGKTTALWTARCLWRSLSEAKAEEWGGL